MCATGVGGGVFVCVTMLPRRPGGFPEVLVVAVAPWPLSASESACVIPSMASLSLKRPILLLCASTEQPMVDKH